MNSSQLMKGYDQKPLSHRTYLDYHRFLFNKLHKQIVSDPTRYVKPTLTNKPPPAKIIKIDQSPNISPNNDDMEFSLVYSEIKNQSVQASSFKESYFDHKEPDGHNLSGEGNRAKSRLNGWKFGRDESSRNMGKKNRQEAVLEGEPILKALEEEERRQSQKKIDEKRSEKNNKLQSKVNNPSKLSLGLESHKDLVSQKESPNTSTEFVLRNLMQASKQESMEKKLGGDKGESFVELGKGESKGNNEGESVNERGQTNDNNNKSDNKRKPSSSSSSQESSQQSGNQSQQSYEQRSKVQDQSRASHASQHSNNKKQEDQSIPQLKPKPKVESSSSQSSSCEEDFEQKITNKQSQKSIQSKPISNNNNNNKSQIINKKQPPSDEDSFYTVRKHNQTVTSNISQTKIKRSEEVLVESNSCLKQVMGKSQKENYKFEEKGNNQLEEKGKKLLKEEEGKKQERQKKTVQRQKETINNNNDKNPFSMPAPEATTNIVQPLSEAPQQPNRSESSSQGSLQQQCQPSSSSQSNQSYDQNHSKTKTISNSQQINKSNHQILTNLQQKNDYFKTNINDELTMRNDYQEESDRSANRKLIELSRRYQSSSSSSDDDQDYEQSKLQKQKNISNPPTQSKTTPPNNGNKKDIDFVINKSPPQTHNNQPQTKFNPNPITKNHSPSDPSDQQSWSESSSKDQQKQSEELVYKTQSQPIQKDSSSLQKPISFQQKSLSDPKIQVQNSNKGKEPAKPSLLHLINQTITQKPSQINGEKQIYQVVSIEQKRVTNHKKQQESVKKVDTTQDGGFSLQKQLGDFLIKHRMEIENLSKTKEKQDQSQYSAKEKQVKVENKSQQKGENKSQQNMQCLSSVPINNQKPVSNQKSSIIPQTRQIQQKQNPSIFPRQQAQSQLIPQRVFLSKQDLIKFHKQKEESQEIADIISQRVGNRLRQQFVEELKSQKELFYYQLKDSLMQQIGDKLQNVKGQITSVKQQITNVKQQITHVNQQITQVKCSINSVKQQCSKLQVNGNQLAKEIVPYLLNEIKPIINEQIISFQAISKQLSTQLKVELPAIVKDQIGNLITTQVKSLFESFKAELVDNIRKDVKKEVREEVKEQVKRQMMSQLQEWKESFVNQIREGMRKQVTESVVKQVKQSIRDEISNSIKQGSRKQEQEQYEEQSQEQQNEKSQQQQEHHEQEVAINYSLGIRTVRIQQLLNENNPSSGTYYYDPTTLLPNSDNNNERNESKDDAQVNNQEKDRDENQSSSDVESYQVSDVPDVPQNQRELQQYQESKYKSNSSKDRKEENQENQLQHSQYQQQKPDPQINVSLKPNHSTAPQILNSTNPLITHQPNPPNSSQPNQQEHSDSNSNSYSSNQSYQLEQQEIDQRLAGLNDSN